MLRTPTCPDPTRLADHAQSNLGRQDAVALDEHLTGCRSCLDRFFELGRQSLTPTIPGCHVVKEIGRGRFGIVYKAWWLTDQPRTVALKVLTCPSEMETSRFNREIAVLTKLDSPWIVKCLDSGMTGDGLYYIMDFVDGVHLDEYLNTATEGLEEKLVIFQRVCRAVADAHAMGVVHRDLKPRNILIDPAGHPHILDFGICTVEDPDWSSWARGTITCPGDVIGTLRYMSPEQAWGGGAGPIDERSDIWSLGIMLYEIVTEGDYPYSLEATPDKPVHEALLERIRKELPHLPRLHLISRGRDLEILLERCLAWEPDHRLQSTAKLAEDLERYEKGRRIKTKPLRMPYRLKRLAVGAASRSRWVFSASFVTMLGITLWAAAFLFNIGWRVEGHRYQSQGSPPWMASESSQARDSIMIVGVSDDTIDAVVDFASKAHIDGVTGNLRTWRAVNGYLMQRLAESHPKAVTWDYYFRTPQAGDARLVSGIRALEDAGVPVILAALTYREDGSPDLSPGITQPLGERLRHGTIVARDTVRRPGEFVLAVKRPEARRAAVVPSLALMTLAAVLHPDARADLDWQGRNRWINLLYEIEPGAYMRERDRIELTKVFTASRDEFAVRRGDLLACTRFELVRPAHWQRQTVPYETLLNCSDDELRTLVGGKLLVIGDVRVSRFGFRADRHTVKYGTSIVKDVPGCYLIADAVAGLLDRRYMRAAFPPAPVTFLCMLLVGAVGCVLPVRLAGRRMFERPSRRRLLWATLLTLSASCLAGMVLADTYAGVHLSMAGFSLATPMLGSFWVEFARNRHRIADRTRYRRAVESFGLTTGGTITLPQRRGKSLLKTR